MSPLHQQPIRSTRSSTNASSSNSKIIKLKNGKQLLPLPFMTVHQLPEYGISTTTTGNNNVVAVNATEKYDLNDETDQSSRSSNGSKKRSIDNISTTHTSLPPNQSTNNSNKTTLNNTFNMPQISASNYKSKKDIAINSLYTPTKHEIEGHIKYLSEEGMKLVINEIDNCVSYTLKYSSRSTTTNGIKLEKGIRGSKFMRGANDLITLASEIHNYFDMFQPDEEEENEELHVTIDESMNHMKETQPSNNIQRQDILNDMLPNKYDPTLLPIVSIKCYPNVLDRIEITKSLVSDLSKKKKERNIHKNSLQQEDHTEKSPCVCILRSTSELVQQGHLITEILSQCISNDTQNGEAFAMELQKQRKRFKSQTHGGINRGVLIKSIWSWTQSLIEWARYTTTFNSIVIVLEDAEKIPSPTLDSFFTTLAALRSNDGVPISVIVVDVTPGGLGDRLSMLRSPSLRGTSGVMTHELLVPLPQTQLDLFVNKLFSGKCLPTFLWSNHRLLKRIQELFEDSDNSIVSAAKKLKTDLRRYFSKPGAFISLLHCDQFTIPNESRMKWLFGDESCRKIILSSSAASSLLAKETDEKDDGRIFDLFWKIQISYLCHQICQQINVIFNLSPLAEIGATTASEFQISSRINSLLILLRDTREKVTSWIDVSAIQSDNSMLCKKLNEYIILTGQFTSLDDAKAPSATIARSLVENIMAWASDCISIQITSQDSLPVQPRRDVAKALCRPLPNDLMHCTLAHSSRIAFQVLESRTTTLSVWHERYFDVVTEQEDGMHSNEAAFFFAVYELVHLGFVRKLPAYRRKEEAYEKVGIMWSNGR